MPELITLHCHHQTDTMKLATSNAVPQGAFRSAVDKPGTFDIEDSESLNSGSETGYGASSNYGSSSHNGSESNADDFSPKQGARAISCSRAIFFIVLIAAAATLSGVIYVVLRNEEAADFEAEVSDSFLSFVSLRSVSFFWTH